MAVLDDLLGAHSPGFNPRAANQRQLAVALMAEMLGCRLGTHPEGYAVMRRDFSLAAVGSLEQCAEGMAAELDGRFADWKSDWRAKWDRYRQAQF